MFEKVRSYSKAEQLKGHQKEKDTPKFKVQKPRKKRKPKENKNIEMFQNRKIPYWKQRGRVTTKEANKALSYYGECCYFCNSPHYALHHVVHKGFGIGGRGVWTNLIPLCQLHHTGKLGPHTILEVDEHLKQLHEKQFGPHFFKDMWDLWMDGLIENPTDELYEKFMKGELERAKENICEGNKGENI